MATKASTKAKNKRKKAFYRILTIVVVSVMIVGILLASMISRLY